MDERCIFCRTELNLFNKKNLHCGNTTQILCKDCYSKYKSLSAVERAEAALNTGRAECADDLQNYLSNIQRLKQQEAEECEKNREYQMTDLKCLRCDEKMLDYGPVTFKLGEETFFFSDLNRLASGSLNMNILRCPKCGKVEFFAFDEVEFSKQFR